MKHMASIASALFLVLCLAVSVLMWQRSNTQVRRLFIYEKSAQGPLAMEARYLAKDASRSEVQAYIDDLLLGPVTHGLKALFASETKASSAFVRDGVLYVDLTRALLNADGQSSDIKTGVELLKRNVMQNFKSIKDVCVFVDGKEAFKSAI